MIKRFLPVIFILLFALSLRLYNLDKVPPALFGDEIDVGYQAYSLLKTGEDFSGKFLPLYIRSLAEYRAPLYIYSAVPFVGIFGLNEWGVRLPAVFWGVISIFGLYLLAKQLFTSRTAEIVAFLTAISPWHLQYSRASFEVTMLISFFIFAIYFFIRGLKNPNFWILSAILFALTVYIYSTAIVFAPLILLLLVIIFRQKLLANKKTVVMSIVTLILVLLPNFWFIYQGEARQRFGLVSIFQDSVLLDKINIARKGQEFFTPNGVLNVIDPKQETIFHNKISVFAQVFTLNYFRAFSPNFLFSEGDPNFRQSIHEMGLLYFFDLILIIFGFWKLMTEIEVKKRSFLLGWLLLAPIPAALTNDGGFHATRLFLMVPPLMILTGLGVTRTISLWSKNVFKLGLILLSFIALLNITFYLHRYYVHYPIESWRWWHTGFKEAMTSIESLEGRYQYVVINNSYEPSLERYLFFTQYDPSLFRKQYLGDKATNNILPGVYGFALNNRTYFGFLSDEVRKNGDFEKVMKPGMLYLASARDETQGDLRTSFHEHYTVIKTIVNPYGDPVFYLLEGK